MTIRDVICNPAKINRAIYRSRYPRIDIVRGITGLKEGDVPDDRRLEEALQYLNEKYDICLIDTRPLLKQLLVMRFLLQIIF